MKILLAEDNAQLNKALSTLLKRNGFLVDSCFDGEEALLLLGQYEYDVIVLDIMMPKVDGLEVLTEARKKGVQTPILLLTAKATVEDKVTGLDLGADDYLPKPFVTEELLARLRALGRRKEHAYEDSDEVAYGDLTLSPSKGLLQCGAQSVSLSSKEMAILLLLAKAQGKMVCSDDIVNRAWDIDASSTAENVWVFVSYLRKKLSSVGSKVLIKSARYQGYYLEYPA